jgi:hypothetical protein
MEQPTRPGSNPKATKKRSNRGLFRKGDPRINRQGRALKRVPTLAERLKAWDGKGTCPACGRGVPVELPRSAATQQSTGGGDWQRIQEGLKAILNRLERLEAEQ